LQGIQAPMDELRPFEGFADFIEGVCNDYPNVKADALITYFYFWHRQGENGGILGEPFNQREKLVLSTAKEFLFSMIADMTREKCGETPVMPINTERLRMAREHAVKLRGIVQSFGIKY
jgi:hypothetical protein